MMTMTKREQLAEIDEDMLLADGFDEALIGHVSLGGANKAVYDRAKCIQILCERDGMEHTDAEDFFSYNVEGAYVGDSTPLFVEMLHND